MDELKKIDRIIGQKLPDSDRETLLVLDATTGQNAVNQARLFNEAAALSGIVLTKLDGTAKGGIIIPIRNELNIPVKLVGVGEKIDDLQPFIPEDYAEALLGDFNVNGDSESGSSGEKESEKENEKENEKESKNSGSAERNAEICGDLDTEPSEKAKAENESDKNTEINGFAGIDSGKEKELSQNDADSENTEDSSENIGDGNNENAENKKGENENAENENAENENAEAENGGRKKRRWFFKRND